MSNWYYISKWLHNIILSVVKIHDEMRCIKLSFSATDQVVRSMRLASTLGKVCLAQKLGHHWISEYRVVNQIRQPVRFLKCEIFHLEENL